MMTPPAFARHLTRLWPVVFLIATLLTPVAIRAQDHPRDVDIRDKRETERKLGKDERLDSKSDRLSPDSDRLSSSQDRVTGKDDRLLPEPAKTNTEKAPGKDESLKSDQRDEQSQAAREAKERTERGFRSEAEFEEHFEKHVQKKAEYGKDGITRDEYLRRARQLRDVPVDGREIKEYHRDDGRTTRYDTKTNDFGVYERDGTVVTFFRPEEGEQYFHRDYRNKRKRSDK